jgi:hypothetical protein
MILELEYPDLLVVFDRKYSLSEIREVSGVEPGSYAEELVERIFNCLFKYSRDLRAEYNAYYAVEYSRFEDFLFWKYSIPEHVIINITKRVGSNIYIGIAKNNISMITDETVSLVIRTILSKLGDKIYEDTN